MGMGINCRPHAALYSLLGVHATGILVQLLLLYWMTLLVNDCHLLAA